ncbi:MAG: helix-turn-helix transcriptional regulator [Pseudomonadota bacterium]
MTTEDVLYIAGGSLLVGLSIFCANLLLLRRSNRHVHGPLALFFLAQAAAEAPLLIGRIAEIQGAHAAARVIWPLNLPTALMLAPLFWLYVRALTTEGRVRDVPLKALHVAPALVGLCVMLLFLGVPKDLLTSSAEEAAPDHVLTTALVVSAWTIVVLFYAQICLYLVLVARLLRRYTARLKDLFSSTESRELRWLWWIVAVTTGFVLVNVALSLSQLLGVPVLAGDVLGTVPVDMFFSVAIFWVLALWGLRQTPGLETPAMAGAAPASSAMGRHKYERSALSEDRAQRLARKVAAAMRDDRLYRDPNLSLWDLSTHIGVTSNHLSQTLNETLGASFFDYVNRWRIEDAAERVRTTDETILAIAYDVGFNSKSSFYKAFKRHLGKTPSALRDEGAAGAAAARAGDVGGSDEIGARRTA